MDRPLLSAGPAGEVIDTLGAIADGIDPGILEEFTRRLLSRASSEWLQSEPAERIALASRALL